MEHEGSKQPLTGEGTSNLLHEAMAQLGTDACRYFEEQVERLSPAEKRDFLKRREEKLKDMVDSMRREVQDRISAGVMSAESYVCPFADLQLLDPKGLYKF